MNADEMHREMVRDLLGMPYPEDAPNWIHDLARHLIDKGWMKIVSSGGI